MAELADHAYAHTTAVLGRGGPALEAAVTAVRRGGRARSAVLGHARAEVLARAAQVPPADLDAAVPEDLTDLAMMLAATRPPLERVVVDLDARHGLDRTALGRALGTSTAAAATRAAEVAAAWHQALDPVLLARFGPVGCDGLAAAIDATATASSDTSPVEEVGADSGPPPAGTLRELLDLGPAVTDHAASCASCTDRLRSMVSVRTLLAQRPLDDAPPAVRAAAAPSRLRRPAPPPPLEPDRARLRWARPALVAAAVVASAIAAGATVTADRGGEGADTTVEALTKVPEAGNVLVVRPAMVEGRVPGPVVLSNGSGVAVTWVAAPDAPWLDVRPSEGRLEPGGTTRLRLSVLPGAPEGDVRGSVQITGRDGSATVVRLAATIERPPDVAAAADACAVQAMVEDEGEIAAVDLHWFEPAGTAGGGPVERITPLAAGSAGFAGQLPNVTLPLTWWVTAADARGNSSRTADQVLPPLSCP